MLFGNSDLSPDYPVLAWGGHIWHNSPLLDWEYRLKITAEARQKLAVLGLSFIHTEDMGIFWAVP